MISINLEQTTVELGYSLTKETLACITLIRLVVIVSVSSFPCLCRDIVIRYTQFAPLVVSYDNHGMYRCGVDSCVKATTEIHFVGRKRNSSGVTRRRLACRR